MGVSFPVSTVSPSIKKASVLRWAIVLRMLVLASAFELFTPQCGSEEKESLRRGFALVVSRLVVADCEVSGPVILIPLAGSMRDSWGISSFPILGTIMRYASRTIETRLTRADISRESQRKVIRSHPGPVRHSRIYRIVNRRGTNPIKSIPVSMGSGCQV